MTNEQEFIASASSLTIIKAKELYGKKVITLSLG